MNGFLLCKNTLLSLLSNDVNVKTSQISLCHIKTLSIFTHKYFLSNSLKSHKAFPNAANSPFKVITATNSFVLNSSHLETSFDKRFLPFLMYVIALSIQYIFGKCEIALS